VNNPTDTVREAINLAIPHIRYKNYTFPRWFYNSLKCYIKKKNQYFSRYKKSKSDNNYSAFSSYCKLVKTTIKTDKLHWLKSSDDNLKTKHTNFWKYVSKFKNSEHVVTQHKIGENKITQPQCIVEVFANHFSYC
jgi:hypothetical protein